MMSSREYNLYTSVYLPVVMLEDVTVAKKKHKQVLSYNKSLKLPLLTLHFHMYFTQQPIMSCVILKAFRINLFV